MNYRPQGFRSHSFRIVALPISSTVECARAELKGQEITIVLLSGGSSNIRWLRPLLERDLKPLFKDTQIIELNENFQEIVAKGLATECACRF